ncbi:hypothetical protein C5C41_04890 [Rathayibacter sp. AY1E9]|uniref:histone-like nucleoid-structuring protein Lsr2 n=1 Tax=unclassified Rathayibacter TaxID=2609250 RepID=UPI000CE812DD|nr:MULTISPECIES: Lsr2 family protein [unclassified Rathayibacter]PPG54186.1 hypothetical protein C5C41_04890 [Rathayibacter sp. AY1E9]PPH38537.1 hypothetical protein C5C86_14470 [Rathayibacter sp. AY1E4]PPH83548.1 hypothetical protein C5C82_15490 [Rathayibacter sp. AY1D5]PPH95853.1 hypothetical protein C5C56_15775 [Rathayibacter sp. AY1D1]
MAQTLTLIDDLNGSAIAAGGTVKFSIEGVNYEIDLSAENAAELRGVSEKYATAGRRVRRERFAAPSASSARTQNGPQRLKAIREWAAENGHEVSPRGPIPARAQEAYDAVH